MVGDQDLAVFHHSVLDLVEEVKVLSHLDVDDFVGEMLAHQVPFAHLLDDSASIVFALQDCVLDDPQELV